MSTAVLGDDDATMMAPGFDADTQSGLEATGTSTEVLENPIADPYAADDDDLDLDLDDLTQALQGSDTVEQPRAGLLDSSLFDDDDAGTPVDLDVGIDVPGDDDPTGTEAGPLDAQTMTEVGTKLDLARAYIDMGDPEGAKSILEEVLGEGDPGQRKEAQSLIDALPA
jgi:pilus assembly protein FimV